MILDNFIESFELLKDGEFKDEVNPIDGVTYPQVCKDIPEQAEQEILGKLREILGREPQNPFMFMRRSPKGLPCPQQVHSDQSMGNYSLMLYITEQGGTSLVSHKESGIAYNPAKQEYVDIIHRDQNIADAWEIIDMVKMKPNRAFIFKSKRLHRAEPVGGYGQGSEARCVLTCFFS